MFRFIVPPLLLLFFASTAPLLAAESTTPQASEAEMGDAAAYLQMMEKLQQHKDISAQVEILRGFLDTYPNSSFSGEVEKNLRSLEDLLLETDPKRRSEERDTERYLRAVEFSKKLSPQDKILLWEQFLDENPKTLYRNEAESNLEQLRKKYKIPKTSNAQRPTPPQPPAKLPVISRLPYKDPNTAMLLATFPGLIVPGIGHWYTKDYSLAGTLTAVRVGGLAVGIPGVLRENNIMIIAGSVLAGFTYLVDIIDAPFSARRYNDDLEQKAGMAETELEPERPLLAGITFTFQF